MDDIFFRPPIASAPLSIVLTVAGTPGWEELLGDWVAYLNGLSRESEILLVGERPELSLEAVAGRFARVRLLPPPEAAGFGRAVAQALPEARFPLLIYNRLDGSYKPQEIQKLLKHIDMRDIVSARRTSAPGVKAKRWRRLLNYLLVRLGFGVRMYDVGSLFLLARRHIFVRIPLQSIGDFAHAEVLAKANFLGCLMIDTEVAYQPRDNVAVEPTFGAMRSDFRRVFFHPDFGPPETRLVLAEGGVEKPS
jgi:hypothetical protein